MDMVKQYEVYFVNLNPTKGSEVRKVRPCVILSPNEMNKYLNTLIISPLTSTIKSYPTSVDVKIEGKKGQVMLDQIRAIDKSRIGVKLGVLNKSETIKVKDCIKEMFCD
jgi:mRNA interferase MazF